MAEQAALIGVIGAMAAAEQNKEAELEAFDAACRSVYSEPKQKDHSRGHVCGHDMGVSLKKQPRNKPCCCGSNKKAKNCCVTYNQ